MTRCDRTGKHRYRDENDAREALARAKHKPRDRYPQRVYQCPFCGGWHLTSKAHRSAA